MANTSKETRTTSLTGRVAAQQTEAAAKQAAELKAQQRTACAWTIAKTMLPNAPYGAQMRCATSLRENSTRVLKAMLRQTAINSHMTRVAEQLKEVHKIDMNDLLENPSVLTKEESGIAAEFRTEPKNAASKKADDRKDAGPLPADYPDVKRDEPSELDGSNAAKGRPESWTEGPGSKEGSKQASHGEGCECKTCKKEASKQASHGEGCECKSCKKEASAKRAASHGEGCECKDCKAAKKEASSKKACGDGCKGDCGHDHDHKKEAASKKADGEGDVVAADDAAAESSEDATAADDAAADAGMEAADTTPAPADEAPIEGGDDAEAEPFDEETAALEDSVEDLKADIEQIEEAIADFTDEPSDISFDSEESEGGEEGEGDHDAFDLFDEGSDAPEGAEGEGAEGDELNLDDIFDEGAMADKVSALNDEDVISIEENDGDDFFSPDDASELEELLNREQEEGFTSPGDMFSTRGVDDDPMARIFTSSKHAAEGEIVAPGELDNFFEANHGSDTRDSDNDHDDDLFADILRGAKQPTRDDKRDTQCNLKEPSKTASKKAPVKQAAGVRRIRQTAGTKQAMTVASLAEALFPDDREYM